MIAIAGGNLFCGVIPEKALDLFFVGTKHPDRGYPNEGVDEDVHHQYQQITGKVGIPAKETAGYRDYRKHQQKMQVFSIEMNSKIMIMQLPQMMKKKKLQMKQLLYQSIIQLRLSLI